MKEKKPLPPTWSQVDAYNDILKLKKLVKKLDNNVERIEMQQSINEERFDPSAFDNRPRFPRIDSIVFARITALACVVAATIKYLLS